jgi:hypothetical protein
MNRAILLAALLLPVAAGATSFRRPVTECSNTGGCYITAYYDLNRTTGAERDWTCQTHTYDNHSGTDFGIGGFAGMDANGSRPIVAAAAGTVTAINDGLYDRNTAANSTNCGSTSCGNYVKLSHADGKITLYCHMKKGSVAVVKDQVVGCGTVLGRVGSSGCSTGPHLHFGVTVGGATDDPYAANAGCGGQTSYWVTQGAYRGLPAETCECTASCSGKQCGSDGCGGSCGTCGAGTTCSGGQCVCAPACGGRQCGDDGCGGSCGSCAQGNTCTGGQCVCVPSCGGRQCGDDGCGGSCGSCAQGTFCNAGACGAADADDDQHDSLAAGGDDCDDADPAVHPGAAETCNLTDDDCDGATDEDLERECSSGCGKGTERCVDGELTCDAPPAAPERCNGRDEDCDGEIDEEVDCGEGRACVGGLCVERKAEAQAVAEGCGCRSGSGTALFALAFLALAPWRRRRRPARATPGSPGTHRPR